MKEFNLSNALDSVRAAICLSSRDWSTDSKDAWIYGIVVGWEDAALEEVAKRHNFGYLEVERLRKLNKLVKDSIGDCKHHNINDC